MNECACCHKTDCELHLQRNGLLLCTDCNNEAINHEDDAREDMRLGGYYDN